MYVEDKKRIQKKGDVEEYTCLSARGYFLLKHCTPSPSTGHLKGNNAAHTLSASVSLSLLTCICLSLSPSFALSISVYLVSRISNYKAISFVGNML